MPVSPERCPRCGQAAPTVVRGLSTTCVACGAPRFPLAAVPVNVAGRPAKVGGSVARVLGFVVLIAGLAAALVVGAILQAIFPAGVAGWIVGGVFATIALVLCLTLLIGGRKLHGAGVDRERQVAFTAIAALASQRGGAVTVAETARALALTEARADQLLTDLAKRGALRLEVDDSGRLLYFVDRPPARVASFPERSRARFDMEPFDREKLEVEEAARHAARPSRRSSL